MTNEHNFTHEAYDVLSSKNETISAEAIDDTEDFLDEEEVLDDIVVDTALSEANKADKDESVLSETSFSYYMQRIASSTPLSKEEEQELGRRIRKGDLEAFDKLVSANLKFVVTVAYRFRNSGMPLADIIGQGNLGLLEAARRYDPERGVKFISYAIWWIRQYIIQGIAEQSGTVRLPIKQAAKLFKINSAREKLSQELGREPTADEIAVYTGLKVESVIDISRVSKQSLSLEAPLSDGEDRSFVDMLEAKDMSIEEACFRRNLKGLLEDMVNELDTREIQIINLRFGFEDDESMTLEELGRKFGISRERIRQLEVRALDKLKKKAVKKGLATYLIS